MTYGSLLNMQDSNESKAGFFSCSDTQPTAMLDSIRSVGGVKGFNITLQAKKCWYVSTFSSDVGG